MMKCVGNYTALQIILQEIIWYAMEKSSPDVVQVDPSVHQQGVVYLVVLELGQGGGQPCHSIHLRIN
jgi:hypothetical protein